MCMTSGKIIFNNWISKFNVTISTNAATSVGNIISNCTIVNVCIAFVFGRNCTAVSIRFIFDEDSEISDNSNYRGGGIYSDSGAASIIRSKLYRNIAEKDYGGGILIRGVKYNDLGSEAFSLSLKDSYVINNTAENGGGIAAYSGPWIGIYNTEFHGNIAMMHQNLYLERLYMNPFPHAINQKVVPGHDMYAVPLAGMLHLRKHSTPTVNFRSRHRW